MIAALRGWLTSVIYAAMVISVAESMVPSGGMKKVVSFTGGLLLLVMLVKPLGNVDAGFLQMPYDHYIRSVEIRRAELEKKHLLEMGEIIEQRTAAYISDKADTLGLEISVRVETERNTDGLPVPASAELTGVYSQELAVYMEKELGIPRERQVWHED